MAYLITVSPARRNDDLPAWFVVHMKITPLTATVTGLKLARFMITWTHNVLTFPGDSSSCYEKPAVVRLRAPLPIAQKHRAKTFQRDVQLNCGGGVLL